MHITFPGPDGSSVTLANVRRELPLNSENTALPQERRPAGWITSSIVLLSERRPASWIAGVMKV
jgi:hypothetical protein